MCLPVCLCVCVWSVCVCTCVWSVYLSVCVVGLSVCVVWLFMWPGPGMLTTLN